MSAHRSNRDEDDLKKEFLSGTTKIQPSNRRCCRALLPRHILLILMVIGAVLGVTLGSVLRVVEWQHTPAGLTFLNFPGEIFLRMLNCLILPLMMSTLVNSLTNLHGGTANILGTTTALFYVITTLIAAVEGSLLS